MPILRALYFANFTAFNIELTKNHLWDLLERNGESAIPIYVVESVVADLTDLEYIVEDMDCVPTMVDLYTHQLIPRDTWFLRYGIRDPTFEYFNGDDDDTIHTFDMTETDDSDDTISSDDEDILVIGSRECPIEFTDDEDSDVEMI